MLVLSRKPGQEIQIGMGIVVKVLDVRGDRVRLGFEAAEEIPIHRAEIRREVHEPVRVGRTLVASRIPHPAEVA